MFSQPALNASLNATSAVLLAGGYAAIRAGKMEVHKRFMVSAFWVSVAFLVSYVTYHIRVKQVVLFQGQGWIRPVYFTLLTSHTILAIVIVPFVIRTLFLGLSGKFPRHVATARFTLPLWLYVSVTGVVIYFMLYRWFAV